MRTSALFVVAGAVLAAGAAGWLVLGGAGGDADDAYGLGAEHAAADAGAGGPTLEGRTRTNVEPVVVDEGEFRIPGKVVDEKGKPLAGVKVVARRRGDAYPDDDPRRWSWNPRVQLDRSFDETATVPDELPAAGTATSGADGTFALVVRRRGEYTVRAEPDLPSVGTTGSWYLNDRPTSAPLVLRVQPGSPLAGRVVDAQDRGVAAIVRASAYVTGDSGSFAPQPVRTAEGTGAFAFPAVPNGKVSLDVAVPGRMRVSGRTVTAPHAGEVVIRIGGAVPLLKGRVKDLQGQGVANARVLVTLGAASDPAAPSEVLTVRYFATTDAEGAYAIEGALGGAVTAAEASAPGYLYATQAPPLAPWSGLELAPGREAVLDLTLWKGGTLDGRVLEQGTGAPLAGVRIRVLPIAVDGRITRPPALDAVTDALGRYHVDGVPVGRSLLLAELPGWFAAATEAVPRTGNQAFYFDGQMTVSSPPRDLTVFVAQEGERVVRDLELVKGLPVAGRVVDAKGEPVEGAQVLAPSLGLGQSLWQWGAQAQVATPPLATSAADGRFEVPGLPPRKDWVLVAKKPPLTGEPCAPFALAAGASAPDLVLKLVPSCTLAGRVVNDQGNAVPGVTVYGWSQTPGPQQSAQTTSADDGAFRLEGVGKGQVQVYGNAPGKGYANLMVEGLTAGEVREGLELKFGATAEVSGVLVDENGKPARFKTLMTQPLQGGMSDQGNSGADGTFKLSAAPGKVRIVAGDWQNNVELTTVDAPSRDLKLTWKAPPQHVIEGTVVDAEGKPVPLCTVSIRPETSSQPEMMAWEGPGGGGGQVVNGWFRRQANGKPPFKVEVRSPMDREGRALNLRSKSITVADPAAGPVTIALEPGLVVAGKVLDPNGRGVENVTVSVGRVSATTGRDGAFEAGGVAEGTHSLNVNVPPPYAKPAPQKVTAGATDVVVRLKTGLPIAGEVRGPGGKLGGNGYVQASWPAVGQTPAGNAHASLQGEGRFRIEGVPEEVKVTLNVQIWSQDGSGNQSRTVSDVRPGTEDLVVELGAGVSVEGVVVDANGKAINGGYVMVTTGAEDKQQNTSWVTVNADGTFKATGLERGPVRLGVQRNDGGPTPSEQLRVEAPASQVKIVCPAANPIRGTLVGAGGNGTAYRVWAWSTGETKRQVRATNLAADGKFSLDGVSEGQWMVAARARAGDTDLYALAGPFAAGSENVSVELRTGRSIEGVVTTGDGTDVPAETYVTAHNETWNARVKVGAKGEFRVRGLPPGRYRLLANTQDGTRFANHDDVDDGASGVRLTLEVRGG